MSGLKGNFDHSSLENYESSCKCLLGVDHLIFDWGGGGGGGGGLQDF